MTQTFRVGARSRFVTFTAWLFIVLAAIGVVAAFLQNASASSWVAQARFASPALSGLADWLRDHVPMVMSLGLALAVAQLVSAIGLLRRLEWARRVFIGLLLLAVVVNLGGMWLQQALMVSWVDAALQSVSVPPGLAGLLEGLLTATRSMAVLLGLLASAALAWMAWRLTWPSVRQEFT